MYGVSRQVKFELGSLILSREGSAGAEGAAGRIVILGLLFVLAISRLSEKRVNRRGSPKPLEIVLRERKEQLHERFETYVYIARDDVIFSNVCRGVYRYLVVEISFSRRTFSISSLVTFQVIIKRAVYISSVYFMYISFSLYRHRKYKIS